MPLLRRQLSRSLGADCWSRVLISMLRVVFMFFFLQTVYHTGPVAKDRAARAMPSQVRSGNDSTHSRARGEKRHLLSASAQACTRPRQGASKALQRRTETTTRQRSKAIACDVDRDRRPTITIVQRGAPCCPAAGFGEWPSATHCYCSSQESATAPEARREATRRSPIEQAVPRGRTRPSAGAIATPSRSAMQRVPTMQRSTAHRTRRSQV